MDQRTRERLPVLPVLVRTTNDQRLATARLLAAAQATEPRAVIDGTDAALRKAVVPNAIGGLVWAEDVATGKRRNLSYEEEEAFWAFATIEVVGAELVIHCADLIRATGLTIVILGSGSRRWVSTSLTRTLSPLPQIVPSLVVRETRPLMGCRRPLILA